MCYNDATNTRGDGNVAFDQVKYINDYNKASYDVIRAIVPKGKGKEIKEYAKSQGKSVSQIIVEALEEQYKLDLSK